jgi:hypothetical protein
MRQNTSSLLGGTSIPDLLPSAGWATAWTGTPRALSWASRGVLVGLKRTLTRRRWLQVTLPYRHGGRGERAPSSGDGRYSSLPGCPVGPLFLTVGVEVIPSIVAVGALPHNRYVARFQLSSRDLERFKRVIRPYASVSSQKWSKQPFTLASGEIASGRRECVLKSNRAMSSRLPGTLMASTCWQIPFAKAISRTRKTDAGQGGTCLFYP